MSAFLERHALLLAVLVLVGITATMCAATVRAAPAPPLILPAEQIVLTTGQTVTTWLDERHGLLCVAISSGGLDCTPLAETTYGRQIGGKP